MKIFLDSIKKEPVALIAILVSVLMPLLISYIDKNDIFLNKTETYNFADSFLQHQNDDAVLSLLSITKQTSSVVKSGVDSYQVEFE